MKIEHLRWAVVYQTATDWPEVTALFYSETHARRFAGLFAPANVGGVKIDVIPVRTFGNADRFQVE